MTPQEQARDVLNSLCKQDCNCEETACRHWGNIITAALKARYNEGLEDAALKCDEFADAMAEGADERWKADDTAAAYILQGRCSGAKRLADVIRALKEQK